MKAVFLSALLATLLFVVASFTGWSQTAHHAARGSEPATDSSWDDLIAGMETMHHAMASVRRSGDSDADFVRLMLPHHQAAIDMARTQLMYGKDPQMRRLAQEIITEQQSEIELMNLWLKNHDGGSSNTLAPAHQ